MKFVHLISFPDHKITANEARFKKEIISSRFDNQQIVSHDLKILFQISNFPKLYMGYFYFEHTSIEKF